MKLRRFCGQARKRKKGGRNMAVMAKPSNIIFEVSEEKTEEFLNRRRNVQAIKEIKRRARLFEKNVIKRG
ncbi:MAG: hypothetical protein ACRC30_16015 [Clostridium sp.]